MLFGHKREVLIYVTTQMNHESMLSGSSRAETGRGEWVVTLGFFWGDKNALNLDLGEGHTTCESTNKPVNSNP